MQRCSYYNLVMLDLWVKRLQVGTSLYLARSSLQAEFSNSSVTFSLGTAHGLCGEDPEIRQAEGKKSATARNPAAGTAAACNLIRGISKPRPKTGQLMVFVLSDRCIDGGVQRSRGKNALQLPTVDGHGRSVLDAMRDANLPVGENARSDFGTVRIFSESLDVQVEAACISIKKGRTFEALLQPD